MLFFLSFFFLSFLTPLFLSGYARGAEEKGSAYKIQRLEKYGKYEGDLEEVSDKVSAGDSSGALAAYINFIVKFSFGLGSIAAVALIVWGGIEYITSESFSGKSGGKDKIIRAFGALLILFSAFIFFDTINPELRKVRFKPLKVEAGGNVGGVYSAVKTCGEARKQVANAVEMYKEILTRDDYKYSTSYLNAESCKTALQKAKSAGKITKPDNECHGITAPKIEDKNCSLRDYYLFGHKDPDDEDIQP